MTKQEAITEMRNGVKITHVYFSPEEWMTMIGNVILLEDGVKCSEEEFWRCRTATYWDNGYSVFNN